MLRFIWIYFTRLKIASDTLAIDAQSESSTRTRTFFTTKSEKQPPPSAPQWRAAAMPTNQIKLFISNGAFTYDYSVTILLLRTMLRLHFITRLCLFDTQTRRNVYKCVCGLRSPCMCVFGSTDRFSIVSKRIRTKKKSFCIWRVALAFFWTIFFWCVMYRQAICRRTAEWELRIKVEIIRKIIIKYGSEKIINEIQYYQRQQQTFFYPFWCDYTRCRAQANALSERLINYI